MATRDRLARPVDISSLYRGAARRVDLIVDQPGLRWNGLSSGGRASLGPALRIGGGGHASPGPAVRIGSGGRRRRRSQLPSWYPRTPLRDITTIMRAIERRRAEVIRTTEAPQQDNDAAVAPNVEVEQESGMETPIPKNKENNDFMTPQKRLLNSIEKVREAWLDEKRKLEMTPAVKKAEREKKVRTLMSMR